MFPNQTINDVAISASGFGFVPGFSSGQLFVSYQNNGTTTMNGTVNLNYDNTKLNFLNASEAVASQTTNQLTFNYSNLQPFESRIIAIDFEVIAPPVNNVGDTLTFTGNITPLNNDYTPVDNDFKINNIVIGSYDPNDITVSEGEEVYISKKDEYLHYLVRFQNTGSAPAINVLIHTDLDPNLDWNTIQVLNSSDDVNLAVNNGRAEFSFNNINLPDSISNEPASHGYVYYKIKPKSNVIVGDNISATASIYFDYNQAVVTNTEVTTFIGDPLSVNENDLSNELTIYPIPSTNVLNVKSTVQINSIEVYNQLGEKVLSNNNSTSIDISSLPKGIYFCKIVDENNSSTIRKFVKQ